MKRVSKSDGLLVNIMDWIYVRYAIFILPLIAILVWYVPYQDITYRAVAEGQTWTYLFPNLRRVFNVPFFDPQKVSGALVVLDMLFVAWFSFTLAVGHKYVLAVKGWQERLAHYKKKESLKLMLYSVLILLAGSGWVIHFNGEHSWMWGGFFYKNEFVFILTNLGFAWLVVWCYLLTIIFFLKLTKER